MKSRLIGALAVATCVMGLAVSPASASTVTYGIIFTSTESVGGTGGAGSFAVDNSISNNLTDFSATIDGKLYGFSDIIGTTTFAPPPPHNLTLEANHIISTENENFQLSISPAGTWNIELILNGNEDVGSADAGTYMVSPTPAALPLFATGVGAIGLLGWRRKRKSVAGAIAVA